MLAKDPKLKAEFDAWLDANPKAGQRARLAWLLERSPFRDARLNAYPVVRIAGLPLPAMFATEQHCYKDGCF